MHELYFFGLHLINSVDLPASRVYLYINPDQVIPLRQSINPKIFRIAAESQLAMHPLHLHTYFCKYKKNQRIWLEVLISSLSDPKQLRTLLS